MITDHIGHHFYPDEMWFRIFGRLCIPIWFYLVGYSSSSLNPLRLWVGAVLVFLSALISGQYLFPLNILFTIAAARYLREGVVLRALYSPVTMRGIFLIVLFGTFPTSLVVEYGSIVMLFVIFGAMMRRREVVKLDAKYQKLFVAVSFFVFFFEQGLMLPSVTPSQAITLFLGFVIVAAILWQFKPITFPVLTKKLTPILVYPIQFLGRYTLEIYVFHVIVFRLIAMVLFPQSYVFMGWHILPAGMISMFAR